MNKKILTAALLGGLAVAQAASAQEFDDRWYLTGAAGFNFQDVHRHTNDAPFVTLGLGKFINPNWSLDGELNYQNPNFKANEDLNWSQYGVSVDLRRHFIQEGRGWNPYVLFGAGYQRAEESFDTHGPVSPGKRKDGNFAAKVGAGLQTTFDKHIAVRAEVAYRADFDDKSVAAPSRNWFGDALASVGVVIPLGPAPSAPVPPPPPPPVAPSCADKDDDGDGVNNCDDKCPDSKPGQTVGPDGCPVPVSIDLKGVNFDFNKSTLRPDAIGLLNEAVGILNSYPDLKVQVAGHTDSIGSDKYNQKLSERRARVVYDYLVKHGVDASRLDGPIGYGKTRPIAPNTNPDGSDNPEGRAKNRRTELNVENK
ncbi:OmpA family protein [Xanthomonas albilineans]|uniref:Putative ompa family outer membrane protein n=1 Tax=Xanthomonas albilineans (strain GPE PC73 / CFBP 7063) TaxID=380358 RepID=D2UB90_XANAP|nr:OmpA family protein [Xanthomonas albilineans]QHQ27294.1 putative ompa family outer membrane protein precursor [Xanthomonas albilineans]CBA15086.1 putative ompa family outer membrane protein precursor [Xanthomonas albilineans GPE PC73]